MIGIQEAGPRLDRRSFDAALLKTPRRFPPERWPIGRGFGPHDHDYMDTVVEIRFDSTARNTNGATGDYRFTNKGVRYQRGELNATTPSCSQRELSRPTDRRSQ